MKSSSRRFCLTALAIDLGLAAINAKAASFTPLGITSTMVSRVEPKAVSADGSVVVGYAISDTGVWRAFRWTASGGDTTLALNAIAFDVSANGNVVIGSRGGEAYRWTEATGIVGLGDLPGGEFGSFGSAVTRDGTMVVGSGTPGTTSQEAMRWSATGGMQGLGFLPASTGYEGSSATDVSADGRVIVGVAKDIPSRYAAVMWTEQSGMSSLGAPPDNLTNSLARAVSADGNVIVGTAYDDQNGEAFRWTSATGMVGLGDLPGVNFQSAAYGVSGDGSVVVGTGSYAVGTFQGGAAFVWTEATGMQPLMDVLLARGTTGLNGWQLVVAQNISDDGQWVVGWGTNPSGKYEAFRANLTPVPIPGTAWLLGAAFGATGWMRLRVRPATANRRRMKS